ncbi:ABC transporter ATP-binding protein [Pelagicoccus albus]|uniref:ABC transporter ATP-binding protein n=1 Tax=Pelagicoccus albus TaxID=415222 RepID=A0A7X1B501_9BACT|nr:ABC transporter ATP-binding protein [Pelagicoccus albus]MBC2605514.1 ABC transporter ATP-binding protein [Pelagicoccus albus]
MEPSKSVIALESVTKDFSLAGKGRVLRALDKVSLSIPANSVFGLLGPNGSGKSTTIRLILGLCKPSSGCVKVLGSDPLDANARRKMAYLPDSPHYHRFLTARELMRFFGKLIGLNSKLREISSRDLLVRFGLEEAMDRRIGTFSKGMLQRLGFAQALLGDPEVIVLDEPTAGVDPVGTSLVGEFVGQLKKDGKTVVLSSHSLAQLEGICDRIGILNKGRLLASGLVSDLLKDDKAQNLRVEGLDTESIQGLRDYVESKGGNLEFCNGSLEDLFRNLVAKDEKERLAP